MLVDIFAFIFALALTGVFGWFLYEVIKLEKKLAQERKARQDIFLETLDSIHCNLASISHSCNSIASDMYCLSDTLDDLLDFDDVT